MNINRIGRDVSVLVDQLQVPGVGFLPVNAFMLHASEAAVVDTGLSLAGERLVAYAVGQDGMPSSIHRAKASVCAAGHAPSHGIVPARSRVRMALALELTSA